MKHGETTPLLCMESSSLSMYDDDSFSAVGSSLHGYTPADQFTGVEVRRRLAYIGIVFIGGLVLYNTSN